MFKVETCSELMHDLAFEGVERGWEADWFFWSVLKLNQHVVQLVPSLPVSRIGKGQWFVLLCLLFVVWLVFRSFVFLLLSFCVSSNLWRPSASTLLTVSLSNFIVAKIVKCSANNAIGLEVLDKTLQKWIFRHSPGVPNQDTKSLCASYCYVHSLLIAQETDFPSWVAPDHCNYDDFFLPSLKAINCRNLNRAFDSL